MPDGYALTDRRNDPHFFVDGFVGWNCYIHRLNSCVYLSILFVDWLELATMVEWVQPDKRKANSSMVHRSAPKEAPDRLLRAIAASLRQGE